MSRTVCKNAQKVEDEIVSHSETSFRSNEKKNNKTLTYFDFAVVDSFEDEDLPVVVEFTLTHTTVGEEDGLIDGDRDGNGASSPTTIDLLTVTCTYAVAHKGTGSQILYSNTSCVK
jgi:hypothetical protein